MNKSDIYYSAFERRANDNYPTIDTRIMDGLIANAPVLGKIVDPCAKDGSAIVSYLQLLGAKAYGLQDAYEDFTADCIVTNPPFSKDVVNKIVWRQIENVVNNKAKFFYLLVRINWDFAKTRKAMFDHPYYAGEIKLLFRPWWTEERNQEPKHNYVWHLWYKDGWAHKQIHHYLPPYEERYAVRKNAQS